MTTSIQQEICRADNQPDFYTYSVTNLSKSLFTPPTLTNLLPTRNTRFECGKYTINYNQPI